jgi:ferrous iron transport protein B
VNTQTVWKGRNEMKLGIVGLPNVGKSTLFNSMTLGKAEAANYPFCTIDPNVGIVTVPDERLTKLTEMYNSAKTTPAVIEFVDIAGLVRGASKGEGLGNKFLSHIREVDAIVHVVRCFEDTNVVHVDGSIDPIRDIETINLELVFSDLEILERRIAKTGKMAKADKSLQKEVDVLQKLKDALEQGISARAVEFDTPEEKAFVDSLTLLTAKPVLYAANVAEDDLADDGASNEFVQRVREYAAKEGSEVFVLCAKIEEEISDLDEADKKEFLADLGVDGSGLDRLIAASYKLLGLISYLTAGPQESRAWTITKGTKAPQAAGKIHSDFERGFIRAEVVAYDDLMRLGSYNAAKEQGLVRSEGKEYVVKDGDVVLFRFNV